MGSSILDLLIRLHTYKVQILKDIAMKKSLVVLVMVLFSILSCKKAEEPVADPEVIPTEDPVIVSKNISTGTYTEVANSTIASGGTTVKIAKPNTPVDGLELIVPSGSFGSSASIAISYAEIKSQQLGANVNPISPVIAITCDGGYAKRMMSLTIPVKIPAGHIPLGFFLDETTGKLEGIPIQSYTTNAITLLSRHFLSPASLKSGNVASKSAAATGAKIIISSIAESVLIGQPIIASGFKPGTDDWEFINQGSYIAFDGHCAGQTIGAMWYYYERKATEGALFNKFSDTPKIWEDNARGYKFCSVLQNETDWGGPVQKFFDKYIDHNQTYDRQKFLTFAGAILVTGEPQAVAIYLKTKEVNTDGTPVYAGHALICYQVSVSSGKLYISDPNVPGTGQIIEMAGDKFKPYMAKLNGNSASDSYPFITYYAKTAVIEWNKIGKRYSELTDNTIGTVAPYVFPAYNIWVKSKGGDVLLKDGMTVTKDTLSTYVECPDAVTFKTVNGKKLISAVVYGSDGLVKSTQTLPGVTDWGLTTGLYVKLVPGVNKLGYAIKGWNSSYLYLNSTERIPIFLDFKWITVYYIPLRISADQAKGQPTKEVKFTAVTNGMAPKSAKYVWNFGDGTATVTKLSDSTAVHTFSKAGTYTVSIELFDNATGAKSAASALDYEVSSDANTVDVLKKCKKVEIWFNGDHRDVTNYGYEMGNIGFASYETDFQGTVIKDVPLVWSGTTCNANVTIVSPPTSIYKTSLVFHLKVTVSPDGKMVTDFTTDENYRWEWPATNQVTLSSKALAGKNVPLKIPQPAADHVWYQMEGPGVQSLLTLVSGSYTSQNFNGKYSYTNWNSKEILPSLVISFF
jgi:hypothetical protein